MGGLRVLSNTTLRGTTLFKTGKNFRIDLDFKNGLHYHRRGPGQDLSYDNEDHS